MRPSRSLEDFECRLVGTSEYSLRVGLARPVMVRYERMDITLSTVWRCDLEVRTGTFQNLFMIHHSSQSRALPCSMLVLEKSKAWPGSCMVHCSAVGITNWRLWLILRPTVRSAADSHVFSLSHLKLCYSRRRYS
jgi:hypothetical protein